MADVSRECGIDFTAEDSPANEELFVWCDDIADNISVFWDTIDPAVPLSSLTGNVAVTVVFLVNHSRPVYEIVPVTAGTVNILLGDFNTGEYFILLRREFPATDIRYKAVKKEFLYLDGETGLSFLLKEDGDLLLTESDYIDTKFQLEA